MLERQRVVGFRFWNENPFGRVDRDVFLYAGRKTVFCQGKGQPRNLLEGL